MATPSQQFTDKRFDARVPPQSMEVEAAVLGAMMMDADAVGQVIEILSPDDFYKPAHRKIFDAILALFDRNEPVDVATVKGELENVGQLDSVGGPAALIDIADSVLSAASAPSHARLIQDKAVLRRLITASSKIIEDCHTAPGDVGDLLDEAEAKIFSISESRARQDYVSLADILPATFEAIEEFHRKGGGITGLSTGFDELDTILAGLHKSELIILAGRPSMGKTALAMNIIENMAIHNHMPCAVFSLEMSKEQLAQRLLCSQARINAHSMRTGRLRANEYSALSIAVGPLSEAPIYIDDTAGMGILELRAKARRLKAQHSVQVIVVDYLQLMHGPRSLESRQQEISMISRSLKSLAKELDLPVIALSQLSRQVEQRGGDRRPQLADLRESGAIEQDADVVMFVYRPERYEITQDKQGNPLTNVAEIIVSKQRNGPTGSVRLTFIKEYARFENMARESMVGQPGPEVGGPYSDEEMPPSDTPF